MTTIRLEHGQNEIYNGAGLQLIGSKSPNQSGLSPKELLEASLGLCISISLQKLLDKDGVDYDRFPIGIDVSARKAKDLPNRFESFHVTVKLPPQLDEAYKASILETVEHACTIGNTLREAVRIETIEG